MAYSYVSSAATTSVTIAPATDPRCDVASALTHTITIRESGGVSGVYTVAVTPIGAASSEPATVGGVSSFTADTNGKLTIGPFDALLESYTVTKSSGSATSFVVSANGK